MDTIKRLPTHPGDILKEELECRRISQKKFSEILGVPYTMLNEILNGKRPITSDFALMIEAALNINPELLINMQARYNMALAREKKALSKSAQIEKYGYLGLFLFVAIPLPGTGAWTGSLVAAVLRMRIWQAFLVITVGVLVSGFITGGIAYGLFTALA